MISREGMDDVVKIKPLRTEPVRKPTREEAEAAVRTLIAWAGDDPDARGAGRHAAARRQGL
jgi:GTP cyclohydrolase I